MSTSLNVHLEAMTVGQKEPEEPAAQISTPARNTVAGKSLAGDPNYDKKRLDVELAMDLQKADSCKFDVFLKFVLFQVMKPDCKAKQGLNHLQGQIEELQFQRFYPEEAARRNMSPESKDEGFLLEARDNILDEHLDRLLRAVLPIANKKKFKTLLDEFDSGFRTGHEKDRYPPYVKLCNALLDELKAFDSPNKALNKDLGLHSTFRKADKLNIRFQVNDPCRIKFCYYDTKQSVERSPDVIVSSYAALAHHSRTREPNYGVRPPSSPGLPMVLSSHEFKVDPDSTRQSFVGELDSIRTETFHLLHQPADEHAPKELSTLDAIGSDDKDDHDEGHCSNKFSRGNESENEEESSDGEASEEDEENGDECSRDKGELSMVADAGDYPQPSVGRKRTRASAQLEGGRDHPAAKKNRVIPTPNASASRSLPSIPAEEIPEPKKHQRAVAGRVQCASYALEMMSYSLGVHHVINILFTDSILWIWYYDRQGIIQTSGISVFRDFPRFIALLFVLQRFSLEDWGIIRDFNPEAVREHSRVLPGKGSKKAMKRDKGADKDCPPVKVKLGNQPESILKDYKDYTSFWAERGDKLSFKLSDLELQAKEFLSNQPHCLAGRATAVVPGIGSAADGSDEMRMVCKIYHPEVQRRHEGVTMDVIYEVAKADENAESTKSKKLELGGWDMFNHLPKFYFYGEVEGTSTHLVRSMLHCNWKGHRTMRIIGMKKLSKLTILKKWDFVKAWLEGVVCHAFLWKNYITHGDPSLSNLMYNEEKQCAVLTDFDLSLLQWEPHVLGTDRTGTIPFMSTSLLVEEYWKDGTIARRYHHELESFIWMLPYTFLLYQDGKRESNPYVDSWRTSDYTACRTAKMVFCDPQTLKGAEITVKEDFKECWALAKRLCTALGILRYPELLMNENLFGPDGDIDHVSSSRELWDKCLFFLLKLTAWHPEFKPLVERNKFYKPSFDTLAPDDEKALQERYRKILQHEYAPSLS